jgi:hypothetical protein
VTVRGVAPGVLVRPTRVVAPLVLLLLLVAAGCGGEDDRRAAYCSSLEKDKVQLSETFGGSDPTALLENLPLLEEVADGAPDDLRDEWQTFLNALRGLDDALDEAGVEPADFADGRPPAGLSAAEQKAIGDAADELAAQEVVSAASGIEQQARDVCRIQLGM